jgi:hypothetical protein
MHIERADGPLPLVLEFLEHNHLRKALSASRRLSVDVEEFRPELLQCIDRMRRMGASVAVLSAVHSYGHSVGVDIHDLLMDVYRRNDWENFVKHTHRLFAYDGLDQEIRIALGNVKGPNAARWRRRFEKLEEQNFVKGAVGAAPQIEISIDDDVDAEDCDGRRERGSRPTESQQPSSVPTRLVLRPLGERSLRSNVTHEGEESPTGDPYLVSQAARVKRERATQTHSAVVELLCGEIRKLGLQSAENRLVDAFCEHDGELALFEVKSITDFNERDQVRHAISQLYEYRFLFDVAHASLWVVLSRRPMSGWLVEYLVRDRGLHVLWVDGSALAGPSIRHFMTLGRKCDGAPGAT